MKNRNLKPDDNFKTPDWFLKELETAYNAKFDFDPCPYSEEEITPETDGLLKEWGKCNYVNPPYSLKLKTAFVLKGIEEAKNGKRVIFLLPVSTSTKLFHDHIKPNAKCIDYVRGRIKFEKKDLDGIFRPTKTCGMHDSMIVEFYNGRVTQ